MVLPGRFPPVPYCPRQFPERSLDPRVVHWQWTTLGWRGAFVAIHLR